MDRAGPYTLLRLLGEGASGAVHAARAAHVDREVAVKVLRADASPAARERFTIEARAAARLRHPGIVRVHDLGEAADGRPYLVMDLVEGEPLAARLARAGPLAPAAAVDLGLALCAAVEHAHRHGILHRDLKPENILLGPDGAPVITDFGLAKDLRAEDAAGPTATGEALGTPAYMAPEQARGEPLDARADVHALGAVLFAALAGRPPFAGASALEVVRAVLEDEAPRLDRLRPGVDRDLATVVGKALEKDPAARYPSASALREDLARWREDRPVLARRPTALDRARRWARRHRAAAGALLAAVALAVAVALAAGAAFARRLAAERARAEAAADGARAAAAAADLRTRLAQEALDTLVYGVREGLDDVPGDAARAARGRLLRRARGLLARLGPAEADPVRAVALHVALGDLALATEGVAAATSAYEVAVGLARALPAADPRAPSARSQALDRLGEARRLAGHAEAAVALLVEARALAEGEAAAHPGHPDARRNLVNVTLRVNQARAGVRLDSRTALRDHARAVNVAAAALLLDPRDPQGAHGLAAALLALGDLRSRTGDLAGCAEAVEAAVTLQRRVAAAAPPGAARAPRALAAALDNLGSLRRSQGDLAAARRAFEASAALVRGLLAQDPTSLGLRRDLILVQCWLADVLVEQGGLAEAEAVLAEARAAAEGARADDPGSEDARLRLADVLGQVARVHEGRGELDAARRALEGALAIHRPAGAAAGRTRDRRRAAVDLSRLADLLVLQGDLAGARAAADDALAERRALFAADPADTVARRELVQALARAGKLAKERGDAAAALAALDEALALAEPLHRPEATSSERRAVALALEARGDAHTLAMSATAAAADFEAARALRLELLAADPTSADLAHGLAVAEAKLGDARRLAGDAAGARAVYEAAAARLEALGGPPSGRFRRDRAVVLGKLVDLALARGDVAEATRLAEAVVAVGRARALALPGELEPAGDLAHALVALARTRLVADDAAAAVGPLEEAAGALREVVARSPGSVDPQRALSSCLDQLGDARGATGDPAGALAAYEESLALCQALHAAAPRAVRTNHDLALTLARVGYGRAVTGDPAAGRALLEQAVRILEKVAAAAPGLRRDLEWARGLLEEARAATPPP